MKLQERVMLFQDRLQQVITHSGLNRSAFAVSIKVDRSTLSQLLAADNIRLPRADTLASIAEVHQVSIDWLLGLTRQGPMGANIKNPGMASSGQWLQDSLCTDDTAGFVENRSRRRVRVQSLRFGQGRPVSAR
jgi:transcriptional regulator with XRE-family HTH domain